MERAPYWTILVGPNALLREGLARILNVAEFRVLASAPCLADPGLRLLPNQEFVLLIIDVGENFDAAIRQITLFKERFPAGRVAVLAHQNQPSDMVSMFRAGANAYFVEVATCGAFIKSLELVMLGESIVPSTMLSFVLENRRDRPGGNDNYPAPMSENVIRQDERSDEEQQDENEFHAARIDDNFAESELRATVEALPRSDYTTPPRLSARQQAILRCLIEGDSNKTIARKISIAEATVKVHVKAILRKIRVRNRTQAAIWGMNHGSFAGAEEDNVCPPETEPATRSLPSLTIAQALSRGEKNGSTDLPAFKLEGASHAAVSNVHRLLRKGLNRKVD